jgi:hypothetical protein
LSSSSSPLTTFFSSISNNLFLWVLTVIMLEICLITRYENDTENQRYKTMKSIHDARPLQTQTCIDAKTYSKIIESIMSNVGFLRHFML